MANLMTLETTCDETAAAIITDQLEIVSSVVASQEQLHQRFQGVVPEIASRAHVQRILPVIDETLRKAGMELSDLDAVAVANEPGLSGSLLVGLMAAKTICLVHNLPLIAINHLQAHVYACRLASGQEVFPCLGFVVSGGHTHLYQCQTPLEFHFLGGTIDDAAGEAFDKVASMLGLDYPGGPAIEKASKTGDPSRYPLPRPLLADPERLEFSFSGLKTAVRYQLHGTGRIPQGDPQRLDAQQVADMAASFQAAVVDCLVGKVELALQKTGEKRVCVGGGVTANGCFREALNASAQAHGYELHIPPMNLCTDNAVMGAIAVERFRVGQFESLDMGIVPGLQR